MRNDLKFALRMLLKKPLFSIVAVLTLGMGMGFTTVLFGLIIHLSFPVVPFPDADRLVTMHEAQDMGTLRMAGARKTTRHFFARYREQYESDTQLAGIEPTVFTIGTGMEIGRQPHRPTP